MSRLADLRQAALEYSLSRAPIFAGLPTDDLHRIAAYASLKRVARGTYLFRQKDPVIGFFIVRRGLVNVHRLNAQKQKQIVHLLRPGDSFAERAITSGSGYPANAEAIEDSEVILIPIEEFKAHLKRKPDLAWRMVTSMSHHLRALVSTVEGLRFKDVETRLLHWLLQRCPDLGATKPVTIELGTSKGTLAAELATRQETLSRTFRQLQVDGLINVHPRSLEVIHPARLKKRFAVKTDTGGRVDGGAGRAKANSLARPAGWTAGRKL